MCLCGPIAPPALVTFMSSDQNVAPEVSLWLSVTVNFSNFSENEVIFPMVFNWMKNGFLWNSNF